MSVGLLLVSLLLSGPGPQAGEDALAAKSRLGKELMAGGRYEEAVPLYRELAEARPGNPGLLLNLGMALHLSGQDKESVGPLQTALRLQPLMFPAALFLGAAHLRLDRPDSAVAPLRVAVRAQPDNLDARTLLVEALLGTNRYAEAVTHLRRLARLAPSTAATWFHLGRAYEALSEQAFRDLLHGDSESAFALTLLAEGRLEQEQRSAAFHLYRKALERGPALRGVHTAVAAIYRSAGHADWAAVEEEKERMLPAPNCAREPMDCAFSAGKHHDVLQAAANAKTPAAYYWLVRAYHELAKDAFGRLIALPPSAESHEWMAQVHRDERRYAESAEEWRKAIALEPGDRRLKLQLALTLRLNQDLAGAQPVLEDLVRAEPEAPEPNSLLGDVLLAQQQPERAIPYFEKALGVDAKRPHDHGALGRAYALLGRPSEAISHLEQSLSADVDGSLRLQLARSYQAMGRSEQAQRALADYEGFRTALQAAADAGQGPPITPP